jgi:inorganic pyrophosphatase
MTAHNSGRSKPSVIRTLFLETPNTTMVIRVFVQNEAGSNRKNYHNEKTFEYRETKLVSRAYPYPYGFIIGTHAKDGCNLDVFVITRRPLTTGRILECEAIGLMEQFEDGVEDHNVLAKLLDEDVEITNDVQVILADFVMNVFRHVEGKRIAVGDFHNAQAARAHVIAHSCSLDGAHDE